MDMYGRLSNCYEEEEGTARTKEMRERKKEEGQWKNRKGEERGEGTTTKHSLDPRHEPTTYTYISNILVVPHYRKH